MNVTYWTGFSKRKNSTKLPATTGTDATCVLKDDTSILSPDIDSASIPANANYMYISDFGRYYYVRDVTKVGASRNVFHLEEDPMGTYKTNVGSYRGLVEYAASSSKKTMTDPRNHPTSILTTTGTSVPLTFSGGISFNNVGGYVIGVLSDSANGDSGVLDYYAMTRAQMQAFANELYSQALWDEIKNQFTNARDSLVSCIWLPMTGFGSGNNSVHIGREVMSFASDVSKIVDRVYTFSSGSISVNFNAISGGAGVDMTYLEKAPYAMGELYLPFVGWVPVDMDLMAYAKSIEVDGYVDVLTGDIVYKVRYGGAWVSTFSGNCATKIPVSGASYDGIGVASGALASIGGLVTAGVAAVTGGASAAITGGLAAAGGGAMAAAKSAELHTMINGGNSSAIAVRLSTDAYVFVHQYLPAESNLLAYQSEQGMPYFEVATISSLSGYIKCSNASVDLSGFPEEKDAVNGYLNSGFYYE